MIPKCTALAALAAITASGPTNAAVTISTAATQNMNCSGGTCTPTATAAVLNVTDLENLLASGSTTVTTTGSGVEAKDIFVKTGLSWTSGSTLTLEAFRLIGIEQTISVQGAGDLAIKGSPRFKKGGNITFANLTSGLVINKRSFTLVNSVARLASAVANDPSGAFALANSYDASQDGTYSAAPVGDFYGTAEGLGNTISNLSITVQETYGEFVGLFSALYGRIDDWNLANVNVQALNTNDAMVGGLVGFVDGSLRNDHVTGTVSGTGYWSQVGGLAGMVRGGKVQASSADGKFSGYPFVGGLVGWNYGRIELSRAKGRITCEVAKNSTTRFCGSAGGLVGLNEETNALIDESFATAKVVAGGPQSGLYPAAGGLIGENYDGGTVNNSYATGTVKSPVAGGLSGGDRWDNGNPAPEINDSYATGVVTATNGGNVGGFVCAYDGSYGDYSDDYWNTDTSGTSNATCNGSEAGISGLTTEQLQSGLPSGFDPKIWTENPNINDGLPYLIKNPPRK